MAKHKTRTSEPTPDPIEAEPKDLPPKIMNLQGDAVTPDFQAKYELAKAEEKQIRNRIQTQMADLKSPIQIKAGQLADTTNQVINELVDILIQREQQLMEMQRSIQSLRNKVTEQELIINPPKEPKKENSEKVESTDAPVKDTEIPVTPEKVEKFEQPVDQPIHTAEVGEPGVPRSVAEQEKLAQQDKQLVTPDQK